MFSLEDKYTRQEGDIFCSGLQTIVRLLLTQKSLDKKKGLNTAGFVSGYRGSPLGGLDFQLWKAKKYLKESNILFQPGINENLAASSIWGTQQVNLFKEPLYEGVFGLWYGKGPGVDQSLDALKHANYAGTEKNGGVLVLAGDDHACKSSSLPHQSDHTLIAAGIPILAPSSVQEILDFGLFGWALSRYSGCWIAMKLVTDIVEASATVNVNSSQYNYKEPENVSLESKDVHLRWPDSPENLEKRLYNLKLPAVQRFVKENKIDRWVAGQVNKKAKLGIITTGKSYHDVQHALNMLGFEIKDLESLGIRLLKIGLVWPLVPSTIKEFSSGVDMLFIVEEKRALIEEQIKSILYDFPDQDRPKVLGKYNEKGKKFLSDVFELSVFDIIKALYHCLILNNITLPSRINCLQNIGGETSKDTLARLPFYCSGCPHNTSTRSLPKGSKALAGIGCHYMAMWITDYTQTSTHMGAEGTPWIGASPFCKEKHVFVNIGDGTYYHSGILAIRASVAAKVNVTYKVLFNDAVAMTGGQLVDGILTVPQLSQQLAAEGVKKIAVVTDNTSKYSRKVSFARGVTIHDRRELSKVQEKFKDIPGVTAIIYDQTCAAENRRRRKRGLAYDPPKRVFINKDVCEGCGDCGKISNCLSVIPIDTELGAKRKIDQSTCNKDYSCLEGFCPSFVTVTGTYEQKNLSNDKWIMEEVEKLAVPKVLSIDKHPYAILVAGVGGTGMVTIGAMLGTAAHMENKASTILDQTGLAQKGGSVYSHVKISLEKEHLHTHKIAPEEADLILGCDSLTANQNWAKNTLKPGKSSIIVNIQEIMHPDFIKNTSFERPEPGIIKELKDKTDNKNIYFINAQNMAEKILGDSIYMNLFMLGFACQKNLLPVSMDSILKTVQMNNVAVENNTLAFNLGRLCAQDLEKVKKHFNFEEEVKTFKPLENLYDITQYRAKHLEKYQNTAYAQKYKKKVEKIQTLEKEIKAKDQELSKAVAKNYHKLLAYKDEYEVARLFVSSNFKEEITSHFKKGFRISFHLAPPFLPSFDKNRKPKKRTYGIWMFYIFKLLARLKVLRGSFLDPFRYTKDRKLEKNLLKKYENLLTLVEKSLTKENASLAIKLLNWPEKIRGFGYIKEDAAKEAIIFLDKAEENYRKSTL